METIKSSLPVPQLPASEWSNLWFGSFAVGLVLLGKIWYTQADIEALLFLLKPVSWLIHLVSNQSYYYVPEQGFYFPNGNFLINASCSGFNWFLLAYLVGAFAGLRFVKKLVDKIALVLFLPLVAYLSCLLVNSTRILFSIIIAEQIDQNNTWLHLAEGTFIYLSSLILWYLACQYFFKSINPKV